jgi:hypothetical protein
MFPTQSKAAKRRERKKKRNQIRSFELVTDPTFYDELHAEAVHHYFVTNPGAVKAFGSDSAKLANLFADQCLAAMNKTDT